MSDTHNHISVTPQPHRQVATLAAFTLVELLVVIFIIGLLLTLAAQGIGRARDQARLAVCMSNLRVIGSYHAIYIAEEGKMPFNEPGYFTNWYHKLSQRYEIPFDAFDCPGTPLKVTSDAHLFYDYETHQYNWKLVQDNLNRPQEFPTLWDKGLVYALMNPAEIIRKSTSPNHKDRASNVLFLDSHVETNLDHELPDY